MVYRHPTSTYTVVSFDIANWNVRVGGQIDFQVEAITGYSYYNSNYCGTANIDYSSGTAVGVTHKQ